jgi:hypothetical protein
MKRLRTGRERAHQPSPAFCTLPLSSTFFTLRHGAARRTLQTTFRQEVVSRLLLPPRFQVEPSLPPAASKLERRKDANPSAEEGLRARKLGYEAPSRWL